MGNKIDTNIIVDGQLAVATAQQTGTIIESGGEIDATALVQTENGPQLAVKTVSVGGGGGGITVDDAMSDTSTNPVQNKVITAALGDKQDTLVSGTNIKTVNSNSLLGSGNIDIDALPDQTGQSGKFLTTDGTDASWGAVPAPAGVYTEDNLVGGTNISIDDGVITGGIDANTLVMFHFNGDWTDSSQYASSASWYNGSAPTSGVTFPDGKFSEGVLNWPTSFAGQYVNATAFSTISHQCTIDFWAKIPNSKNFLFYLAGGAGNGTIFFGLSRGSANTMTVYVDPGPNSWDSIDTTNLDLDTFNHYAACFDDVNKQVKVFGNGKLLKTVSFTGTLGTFTTRAYLRPQSAPTDCIIDEFRISNIVRWDSDFSVPTAPYNNSTRNVKKINNTMSAPSVMTGATSSVAGERGLVPAPASADRNKFLKGDATWGNALENKANTTTSSISLLGTGTTYINTINIGASSTGGSGCVAIGTSVNTTNASSTVALGPNAESNRNYCVVIGSSAKAKTDSSIAIGVSAQTSSSSSIEREISIGASSSTGASYAIALGYEAHATGERAIQIGEGTNSTANTFSVGLASGHNYQLLDANGQIPAARLGTGFDASKTQVLKNVNGVLTWVDEA